MDKPRVFREKVMGARLALILVLRDQLQSVLCVETQLVLASKRASVNYHRTR